MPKMSPTDAAAKWSTRSSAATEDYRKGVQGVTESPMEKAVKAQAKMLQNIMEAINSGRWADALRAVSLSDWKEKAGTVGASRYAPGVQAAVGKQETYYRVAFPEIERLQGEIAAMPNVTIEDSIARAAHFMRGMHAIRDKLAGG